MHRDPGAPPEHYLPALPTLWVSSGPAPTLSCPITLPHLHHELLGLLSLLQPLSPLRSLCLQAAHGILQLPRPGSHVTGSKVPSLHQLVPCAHRRLGQSLRAAHLSLQVLQSRRKTGDAPGCSSGNPESRLKPGGIPQLPPERTLPL